MSLLHKEKVLEKSENMQQEMKGKKDRQKVITNFISILLLLLFINYSNSFNAITLSKRLINHRHPSIINLIDVLARQN